MAVYHLTLPPKSEEIDVLRVGDIIYLSGEITVTGGLPAHKRIVEFLDKEEPLPLPVTGAFLHLPHMVEKREGDEHYTIHYVNPTTSTRFDGFMPRFIKDLDLKIVGGKGGLGAKSVAAMKEAGCVYVSLLGGGSPILSAAIRDVVDVAWCDFPSHFRLSRLMLEDFGPLTVGIDAHGNSVYEDLSKQAEDRLPAILQKLERRREEAASRP